METDQIPAEIIDAAARAVEADLLGPDYRAIWEGEVRRMFAAVWDQIVAQGDGYHTQAELYRYRMLYNAHAAAAWLTNGWPVVKSWKHADGQQCFGGGWFIVTATLPTGQVSNHYQAEQWDLFAVPEVDLPPVWDGHTPADAAVRLEDATGLLGSNGHRDLPQHDPHGCGNPSCDC